MTNPKSHPDPSGPIRTDPDPSGPIRTDPDRSGPIRTDPDRSDRIRTNLIFRTHAEPVQIHSGNEIMIYYHSEHELQLNLTRDLSTDRDRSGPIRSDQSDGPNSFKFKTGPDKLMTDPNTFRTGPDPFKITPITLLLIKSY